LEQDLPNVALHRFARCRSGHFAVMVGLLAPVLLGVTGGAIDLFRYISHQKGLQNAADGAALAAAREASLGGWSAAAAEAVADAYVQANVRHLDGSGAVKAVTTVDSATQRISVEVEQDDYAYFVMGYFRSSPQIRVSATAQASGSTNICVIGLSGSEVSTVELNANSVLHAPNCAVYSNSTDTRGMVSKSNSILTSALACSAGGYEGAARNYSSMPLTDCPAMADPLADRPAPAVPAGCKEQNLRLQHYVGNIAPGTYCGGLVVDAHSTVTMLPGIYVMKDGPFIANSDSVVRGVGVGVYFTGAGARFEFKSNAEVSLEAPKQGEMAGIIFFQDRSAPILDFLIESQLTRNLLGTIYLARGNLVVNTTNRVADQSAYTAIVVHKLLLNASPRLVLNTDYDQTTVPVPEGLGPTGQKVVLTR